MSILLDLKKVIDKVVKADTNLEFSSHFEFGDFTSNIALISSKKENKNPLDLAKELIEKLKNDTEIYSYVDKIEIAGPGFMNFWIKKDKLIKDDYSDIKTEVNSGKKVIVEFSSPNIAKPFTVGHLRSTIIGNAIANLMNETGWSVYKDNHIGDWGTQFGKQIYAIKTWGNEEEIAKSPNPVKDLVALYVKFHQEAEIDSSIEDKAREWFKKLENGDPEAKRLWLKCIDWSWVQFEKIYNQLGIEFTENSGRGYGESYFEDKMEPVIDELKEKNLLQEGKEGAQLVFFPQDKYPALMILKKDGTTLYSTRDLATDKFRLNKYGKDILIINEVGSEQSLYFKQLYELEKILGWVKEGQRIHIKHGLFRFKDKKMSTRKGNVIWLEDVINEAIKRAKELGSNEELSLSVATGALIWNELKRDPIGDIVFDWDEILSMEGNSGPYLQYTYARCMSVLKKSESDTAEIKNLESIDFNLEEEKLLRHAVKFEDVVIRSANTFSPNLLCNYLFELAQIYNEYYAKHKIIGSDKEMLGVHLTKSTALILKKGLGIMGISTPEKM